MYVPSYICEDATASVAANGQEIEYYPVQEDLKPDWDWLERQALQGRGRALLLVHYFGFPNDPWTAREFCRRHGLAMIEDCAHSFLTQSEGQTIGTVGDAAIYSYRKLLPLPNGAGLLSAGDMAPSAARNGPPVPEKAPYRAFARQMAKYSLYRMGIPRRIWLPLKGGPPGMAGTHNGASGPPYRGMSQLAFRVMKALEPHFGRIAATRRDHYQALARAFSELPEARIPYQGNLDKVCPYLFPILVSDRDALLRDLNRRGIPAQTWPDLPEKVWRDPQFRVAHRYTSELLAFPVHQDLTPAHVDAMIEGYRAASRAVGVGA